MGRPTRLAAAPLAVIALAVVTAACTGDSGGGAPPASSRRAPQSSSPPSPVDARPGTASLTVSGDPGLAGAIADAEVTCSFPDVDGLLRISVLARAADPTYTYRITVAPESVIVQADSGEGSTFRERNFQGTGVTGFDARRGAQLAAEVSDAAPSPGVDPGSVGRVSAVTGSIACGDQTPGSSTLTVTGETPTGRYDRSPLDPVVVECYFADGQVTAIGVAHAGTARVLLMVSLGPEGLSVEEALGSAGARYYTATPAPATAPAATLDADGGHADGDVAERDNPRPHTLHVEGSVRCGTPIRS
jgi:hypothetical protein